MNSDDDQSSISSDNSKARSITGSFRKRIKSIGSRTDRNRSSIVEGTKTLVKKAIPKHEICDIREETKEENIDLFDSIKFVFPAFVKSTDNRYSPETTKFEPGDFQENEELEPPPYPPPPVPEQFYDEVYSDRSSNSYSDIQCDWREAYGKLGGAKSMDLSASKQYGSELDSDHLSAFCNASKIHSSSVDSSDLASETLAILKADANTAMINSFFSGSETSSSTMSTEVPVLRHSYENWDLKSKNRFRNISSNSNDTLMKSVISQFDPLFGIDGPSENTDFDFSLDSINLLENIGAGESEQSNGDRSEITVAAASNENPTIESDRLNSFRFKEKRRCSVTSTTSNVRRAMKAVCEVSSWSPNVIRRISMSLSKDSEIRLQTETASVSKPDICVSFQASLYSGYLYNSPSMGEKSKDFVKRWCQISEKKLYYSIDKDSAKESVDLNSILSICLIKDQKRNNEGNDLYCFEITTSSSKGRGYLFATTCTSERCVWMQKLLENLCTTFPPRYSSEFIRAGWCFLKEGINGTWTSSWILLQKRTLIFTRKEELNEVDLRKARSIVVQDAKSVHLCGSGQQAILLDTVNGSLHLIMGRSIETTEWQRTLKAAATDNSISLEDQQLTKDDIPVIVEKCINFICAHGSMSEGIYRCNGSLSRITRLLSLFRQDSWLVQLCHCDDYTEHDVANVLKKFFRDLPEPLFTSQLHKHFCNASAIICSEEEKLSMYRSLLEQMKPINYVTLRKLIGHLHFIQQLREINLMPVENLSSLWGPTLMRSENVTQWSKNECEVVNDLILLYPKLFMVEKEELERETRILQVLKDFHNLPSSAPQVIKPSGDLKVWIYLNSKETGKHVNIRIDPNKYCDVICEELAAKMDTEPHLLCIQEVICNECLKRPLHHKESLLDSVLRWGYWDEADRKNNYLILTCDNLIRLVLPIAKPPLTISGELKFADRKMKSFKKFLFEVNDGKLAYYKDKKSSSVKIREWNVRDLVWYDGYESKRNPHSRWAITFITKNEKQNRNKDTPYFGYTIAGSQKEEQLRWMAALLLGQHSVDSLLPPPILLK